MSSLGTAFAGPPLEVLGVSAETFFFFSIDLFFLTDFDFCLPSHLDQGFTIPARLAVE